MDEQMIRELALAIQRADDEKAPDSPLFPDDPEISDWGIHIARAAHGVMVGKIAELIEAATEYLASQQVYDFAVTREAEAKLRVALAAYPERRSE